MVAQILNRGLAVVSPRFNPRKRKRKTNEHKSQVLPCEPSQLAKWDRRQSRGYPGFGNVAGKRSRCHNDGQKQL
jgi:hypothetical protein